MDSLEIRPARPADEPAVGELLQAVDPDDWALEEFPAWIGDPENLLLVALAAGRPVGAGAAAAQGQGTAWFHSLRVHPEARRRGVARAIQDALEEWARARGMRLGRLAVMRGNDVAQRVVERLGFRRGPAFRGWRARASYPRSPGVAVAGPEHRPWLRSLALTSPLRERTGGLYAAGWSWRPLDRATLEAGLEQGRMLAHEEGFALLEPYRGETWLAWLEGSPRGLESLARRARAEAADRKARVIQAQLPDAPELERPLRRAGYATRWRVVLYEKALLGEPEGSTPAR